MSSKIIHSADINSQELFEPTQELLNEKVDYQLSFSDTKTSHDLLKEQFNKHYQEILGQQPFPYRQNLLKLYQSSQSFVSRLERSKLYKEVDLYMLPGSLSDQVHLHFQIKDRSPFFLSLQNNFDRDGAATLQLKTGLKNFVGLQDTLSFDFERQLSGKASLNWALMWLAQRPSGEQLNITLSQSERPIHQSLSEQKKGFNLRYTKNQTEWSFDRSIRANRMQFENLSIQETIKNQSHLQHLDFLPSLMYSFACDHTFKNTLEESSRENIRQGQLMKIRGEMGLPWLAQSYIKSQISHHLEAPLYKYKNWLRNLRNASFQSNITFGGAVSRNLRFSETFNSVQMRGFPYHQLEESFADLESPKRRALNLFGKADLKLQFHNVGQLRAQQAKMFYFLSGYAEGQKDHQGPFQWAKRFSGGIGVALPVNEFAQIEVLLNMFHGNRRRFDNAQRFQLRISIDD